MNQTVTIAHNAVTAKIVDENVSNEVKKVVQNLLSYQVEGAAFSQAFKTGKWDGRSSFYNFRDRTFPRGFVQYVSYGLKDAGYNVRVLRKPLPEPLGDEFPVVDDYGEDPRYSYQRQVSDILLKHGQIIAQCATGCHAKGTKVIMYDGSLKCIEDVCVGDKLMGVDSTPRTVLELKYGFGKMYKITPNRCGSPFIVNEEHILSLEQTKSGKTHGKWAKTDGKWRNVSVKEYLEWDKNHKHLHKLHRSRGVDFVSHPILPLEPYMLGLLLGDGSLQQDSISITTPDVEIVEYISEWASKNNMFVTKQTKKNNIASSYSLVGYQRKTTGIPVSKDRKNKLNAVLENLNLRNTKSGNKHIPQIYKTASRQSRLELLAGLIDTDGHHHNNCIEYCTKSPQLAEDFVFVARSCGFGVHIGVKIIKTGVYAGNQYFRISVSGDTHLIPLRVERKQCYERQQKKDIHVTGFKIERTKDDNFYGFTLDGDQLYLLEDFTVTHNSGKSRICALAAAKISRPTLFLTTRGVLMYQMARIFKKAGRNVAIFGDGFKEVSADVICGMVQTISSWLKETTVEKELDKLVEKYHGHRRFTESFKKQIAADAILAADKQNKRHKAMVELLQRIEFVILEEAHESSGNSYFDILKHCKNANYRLALTATPFMRDSEESNMRLMASSGHIGIQVTERELIDKGILAKPYFKFVELKESPPKLTKSMSWQRAYELGIVENEIRNKWIVTETKRAVSYGLSVMILVQRKKHGEILLKMLRSIGITSEYIYGEDNQEERDIALGKLKHKQIDVLIGTTILDVGVDVPAVGMVILAGGGKAEVALRQRIGRGLREKKDGSPNVALIVDFADEHNRNLREHALQRKQIILNTDGFKQNIVSDFDYKKLGFLPKAV